MKLDSFTTEFDTNANKESIVKRHVKDVYVPFIEKVNKCMRIVHSSCRDEDGGFRCSSWTKYLMYTMTIVETYTDIEVDWDYTAECYDELNKRHSIETIMSNVSEEELQEFGTILQMVEDDLFENERSFVSFVENKMKALTQLLNGIDMSKIADAIKQIEE